MFKKILIANRGEIALRVVRACRELGIPSVVAFSEGDRDTLAVRAADEAVCIGPSAPGKSYLHIPAIMSAALISGCDAIHPGYGFLSENPYIGEICAQLGVTFIGPAPSVIERMADKALARQTMKEAGLPVLPGSAALLNESDARERAAAIGYPVLLKAVGGGGGRGMRVVESEAEIADTYAVASNEARNAFNNADLYLEKYLIAPRHVEVQVLGDNYGHIIHLGTRDCSLQRRHQKVLEEAPAPGLSEAVLKALGTAAVKGCKHLGYSNAGTLEFLVDREGAFYFMEMNTRIQVEHGVTEMVTGVDLVKWQIRIAAGAHLTLQQKEIRIAGHAIECRINAEDPAKGFLPQAGMINLFLPPGGIGVRVDSHVYSGYSVPTSYDSLVAKIMVWGEDRTEAIARMRRALGECIITGPVTTVAFQQQILSHRAFVQAELDTGFLPRHMDDLVDAAIGKPSGAPDPGSPGPRIPLPAPGEPGGAG
ncbi:MAG TPA: acetyl-CoA carboxylase biotin carboxylase subunit [Chloroflexia bacterium]|nr:acetyl-CoA carboxylase biotin carboxylase subunit [Chloroflexia bacterium]